MRRRHWLPAGSVSRRSRGLLLGGTWLHLRVLWQAKELDRKLAAGVDPFTSDALSLRCGQLVSPAKRASLACALEGAVELAARPPDPWGGKVSLARRSEVRACRTTLLELATALRHDEAPCLRGLAMASLLVCGADSPLYPKGAVCGVARAAESALVALAPATSLGDSGRVERG